MRFYLALRVFLARGVLAAVAAVGSWLLPAGAVGAVEPPVDFNRQIRPLLTNQCFRCHGPDETKVEAGLRLDSHERAVAKLDSGHAAIVPGKPEESALIARITSADDDERMPPKDAGIKLEPAQVELLKRWIAEGANYSQHWSFVPPVAAAAPTGLSNPAWVRNPIDAFVMQRLDREKLSPSPEANRYTLIRRLSLDLTGLPPTIEEVDQFVNDTDPRAYENLVDRLLKSSAYGERWARVWLDLARFADSAGYAQDPPRTIWRYRDWVIDALNANMPFDQFTIEQLAGDMLPNATESQIIATAFHRNTMTNSEGGTDDEEFRTAAIVDRVNTTMEVWMGLTMGCAQCHNHKYDPISQEDYYRFFAILNNTEDADRGDESPTLVTLSAAEVERKETLAKQAAELEAAIAEKAKTLKPQPPARTGDLPTRFIRVELPGKGVFLSLAEVQVFVGEKNVATEGKATQISTAYDGPPQLAIDGNTSGDYFAAKSTTHTDSANDPWWEVDLGSPQVVDRLMIWNRTDGGSGGRLANFRVVLLDEKRQPLWVQTVAASPNPSVEFKPPRTAEAVTAEQLAAIAEYQVSADAPELAADKKKLKQLQDEAAAIKGVSTPIMRELPADRQRKTHIMLRGNSLSKGAEVTPGTPAAFPSLPEGVPPDRLGLAKWLVSPQNPLTARVVVNRHWEQLFGVGLVETLEDFGLQGEPPSHPELLDFLAVHLMNSGWDTKGLVKLIVTSATYRQESKETREMHQRDPKNRLLSHGPRFRVSAEMIRDQALFVAGLLSRKMYGPSVQPPRPNLGLSSAFGGSTDWTTSPGEDKFRRGLYTSWRRTTPYPSMTTFDAPSREFCSIRCIRTNTPLQALVTLNDPVYVEAAQALARRMVLQGGATTEQRAAYGFRLALARSPRPEEAARLVRLFEETRARYAADEAQAMSLATDPLGPLPADMNAVDLATWTVVANVLMNLDEFIARR